MNTVLYRAGSIYTTDARDADTLIVRDGQIIWLGDYESSMSYSVDCKVDFGDAFIAPGFVDSHVHLSATGLLLTGIDLTRAVSAAHALQILAEFKVTDIPIVLGHGWDETNWPDSELWTVDEISRIFPDRPLYISRIDVHSAIANRSLLDRAGISSDTAVSAATHHKLREYALSLVDASQLRRAIESALRQAAENGIVAVHENAGPVVSGELDFQTCLELGKLPQYPMVFGYWGDTNVERAVSLGAHGAAGDLFIDGSIGSHTACLSTPYTDADTRGSEHINHQLVLEHLENCTQRGYQGGFHAIGDAALESIVAALRQVESTQGLAKIRQARHRIEHAEMLTQEHITAFAHYGVVASMQPRFDEFWAGPNQMYEQRLGAQRVREMNAFADLLKAGVVLAFSSDSPVTPIGAWAAIKAAMNHSNPNQRISGRAAFAAHTRGGWRAAGIDNTGTLTIGAPAHFAVWERSEMTIAVADERVSRWSTDERAMTCALPDLNQGLPRAIATYRDGLSIYSNTGSTS